MSLTFIKNYVSFPKEIGAVFPSSSALCKKITDGFDWDSARFVVEYGTGTGVVVPQIKRRKHPDCKYFAIEKNPEFCRVLQRKFPDLDLCEGSVEDVEQYCKERHFPHIDIIISGLPWAAFPDSLQDRCMEATMQVLKPGGGFATFAYSQFLFLPAAKRFRKRLNHYFSKVTVTKTVWKNIPPAIVYHCYR
jgi:phosphatidylethanolamine/phosphatidyl-N-methylethanolamine N-methyltransferase